MRSVLTVVSLALLAACGGGPETAESDAAQTLPTSQGAHSLRDACSEAERLVASYGADETVTAADLAEDLQALADQSDAQAASALQILIVAVKASDTSALAPGDVQGVVDAQAALDLGIETFAGACDSVGSSAFQ